jgi:hypothetical protein
MILLAVLDGWNMNLELTVLRQACGGLRQVFDVLAA